MRNRSMLLLFSVLTMLIGLLAGVMFHLSAIYMLPENLRPGALGICAGIWFMFASQGMLIVLGIVEPLKPDDQGA